MNIAVKFWKDNPEKPLDFPDMYPWECREIGEATEFGAPGEWTIMSKESYEAYHKEAESLKQAWDDAPDTLAYKLRVLWKKWFK